MQLSNHFRNLTDPKGYLESEIGFIDVILAPLFEAANDFMKHNLNDVMDHLKTTRGTYERRLEENKASDSKIEQADHNSK